MTPPSYHIVIELLNALKRYYMRLSVMSKPTFSHREKTCTTQFHGKKVYTTPTREQLLHELRMTTKTVSKIPMPKTIELLMHRKLKTFSTHLAKEHDAETYPALFITTVCTPLKEELITIYRHDADKLQWLLAGFAIFEKG